MLWSVIFTLVPVFSKGLLTNEDVEDLPLLRARCKVRCFKTDTANSSSNQCYSSCLRDRSSWQKPGQCPALSSLHGDVGEEEVDLQDTDALLGLACREVCSFDADCQYTLKCCPNGCGVTCQTAAGLEHNRDLPSRPVNVQIVNGTKKKSARKGVILKWPPPADDYLVDSVVMVVEARSHSGRYFSKSRLSDWIEWPARTDVVNGRIEAVRPRNLKPGSWYQFRVAAVNKVGSRGFSVPTEPFPTGARKFSKPTLAHHLRGPSNPINVRVETSTESDSAKSLHPRWLLRWDQPTPLDSELRAQRYKVFWSRMIAPQSILVRHHTVSGDKTSFLLEELQPNAQYFLQVQALAQFGKASEKAGISFNTTVTQDSTERNREKNRLNSNKRHN